MAYRNAYNHFQSLVEVYSHDNWVPVTMSWCVLRVQMKEWPPIWKVAANILNKQLWTASKGWSSSLVAGQVDNNSSP